MTTATLLLRESVVTSLTSIVEKSQHRKPPLPLYDLRLNSCQLDFVLISEPDCRAKLSSADEGFESDIDTVSIVSSDDSFTSGNSQESSAKIQETDSANGSASSDSDTETASVATLATKVETTTKPPANTSNESYHLVDCMCYTDIKFPNILVFVVKHDALVFRFENLDSLKNFYANFSTFKAIANQKAYTKNFGTKFNLLQRTDKNGITHIEITKEPEARLSFPQKCETSSIISLNTPETNENSYYRTTGSLVIREDESKSKDVTSHNSLQFNIHKESRSNLKDVNSRRRSESPMPNDTQSRKECNTKNSHSSKVNSHTSSQRSASSENILDLQSLSNANSRTTENSKYAATKHEGTLKKVWNSAEDLLDSPKRPERRRKPKPKAPPAPDNKIKQDILRGQYVRVNVTSLDIKPPENNFTRPFSTGTNSSRLQNFTQKMLPVKDFSSNGNSKPKELTFQQFKFVEPKRVTSASEIQQNRFNADSSWTYSVPRFLRKPRSHSETRNFTPMAYRYIDTTQSNLYYANKVDPSGTLQFQPNPSNVSNRLFGMSSKLKDFSSIHGNTISKRYENWDNRNDVRRSSLGELSYKINSSGGSLKSVIKKDDTKRRNNEKKVTFSAYTTVQVV